MKNSIAVSLIIFCLASCGRGKHEEGQPAAEREIPPIGFFAEDYESVSGTVRPGETFSGLMNRLGMGAREVYNLTSICDGVFDVRRMRADAGYQAYYSTDSTRALEYLVYSTNRLNSTVFKCRDSLAVWVYDKPVEFREGYSDIIINESLWNDMVAAGAPYELILDLDDIYAWTVDFFSLQKGDRFQAIYTERLVDGEFFDISAIDYARYTRGGQVINAVRYDQGDGSGRYWNEKGESLRKAFLKAPLKFTRISSGFSYHRLHPVHGTVRPHTGVDYAAPTGTPVMSIGDGTVISKGWGGGGGNTVKIRHNSVYTTAYLHLSKYASGLKVGDRVHQGQVIGYVGMTGTATGPHLDFRVWKNGSPINPLKMESPSGEPIREEFKPALDSVYRLRSHRLDSLLTLPPAL